MPAPRRVIRNDFTKSWDLNGTTSYGTNAGIDYSAYQKLVIECSVLLDVPKSGDSVIAELSTNYGAVTDGFALIRLSAGKIEVGYRDGGGFSAWDSNEIQIGQWTHIIGVLDKTRVAAEGAKVYVNSALSGALLLSTATTGGAFGNRAFYMGARAGTSLFTDGKIKQLRIFTHTGTFNADDAKSLYTNVIPAHFTKLNDWIGEDAGTTATDTGSLLKNLTLSNVTYSTRCPSKTRT